MHLEFEKNLLAEEKYKTLNHYLTAKYQEEIVLPQQLVDQIVRGITESMYTYQFNATTKAPRSVQNVQDTLREHL